MHIVDVCDLIKLTGLQITKLKANIPIYKKKIARSTLSLNSNYTKIFGPKRFG